MNAKLTSIAIALIATSASAFAADISTPAKTRAEVRFELEQAYAQGEHLFQKNGELIEYPELASTKSRAQVRTELATARAQAQPGTNTEYMEQDIASGKTRAEVRAELAQAYAQGNHLFQKNGELIEYPELASSKSREEVREEALRAAKAAREQVPHSGS